MNYQHIYHAGNFADVMKHALLWELAAQLSQKDKAFCILETHAGAGRYALDSEAARKTDEAQAGIFSLPQQAPPALAPWLDWVRAEQQQQGAMHYPGSPWVWLQHMRAQDQLMLVDKAPAMADALRQDFAREPRVQVHARDAYEAMRALTPPSIRRGVVFIDPPYEDADEMDRLPERMHQLHRRWPTGILVLWYPLKNRLAVQAMHRAFSAWPEPLGILRAELTRQAMDDFHLAGTGMLVVQPPWGLERSWQAILQALEKLWQVRAHGGGIRLDWLKPAP